VLATCGVLALAGCSDSGTGLPVQDPLVIQRAPQDNGDEQSGIMNQDLEFPIRVLVTRDDVPEADVEVQWVVGNSGSVDPGTSITDETGIAQTTWSLGPFTGEQVLTAYLNGAEGSPLEFTATASSPPPPPPGGASRRPIP
jgi:hypothetical protein